MALTDNIVAYWKLDEESGTRFDEVGSNDLADNNTVLFDTGIIGNAADFELSNTEYLSIADNADLSMGDIDFSITLWVNMESDGSVDMYILNKWEGSDREYFLRYTQSTDTFTFRIRNGDDSGNINVSWSATLTTGVWYFVFIYHDATANEIGISINDGIVVTIAASLGVRDGTADFGLGVTDVGTTPSDPFDGLIDEGGIWKRVLTGAEVTELYNGGAGITYPFGVRWSWWPPHW